MKWWQNILPLQGTIDPETHDRIMLVRSRLSRIYFLRRFFDYPVSLSFRTFMGLGMMRSFRIALDYAWTRLFPIKPERSLKDFFINRFGKELYKTFFKSYTEKVWGVPCENIDPQWGAQRVKGLSVIKAVIGTFFGQDTETAW